MLNMDKFIKRSKCIFIFHLFMPQLLFSLREEALQMTSKILERLCFFFVSLMIKATMLYI